MISSRRLTLRDAWRIALALFLGFFLTILLFFAYGKGEWIHPRPLRSFIQSLSAFSFSLLLLTAVFSVFIGGFLYFLDRKEQTQTKSAFLLWSILFTAWWLCTFPWGQWIKHGTPFFDGWIWYSQVGFQFLVFFFAFTLYLGRFHPEFFEKIGRFTRKFHDFAWNPQPAKFDRVLLGGGMIFLLTVDGFVLSIWMGGIPHVQDEITQFFQARLFSLGEFSIAAPEFPKFFERLYVVVHDGRWYTIYPPGHALFLALALWLQAPQWVNPAFTAFNLLLVHRLALRLCNPAIARISVLLLLLSPFFVLMGGSYMNHPSSLFLLLLFLHLLLFEGKTSDFLCFLRFSLAGFLYGFAFLTRPYSAIAFLVTGWIAWFIRRQNTLHRRLLFTLFFLLGAIPPALFYFAYNQATTGSPFLTGYQQYFDQNPLGFGSQPWGENPLSNLHVPRQEYHTPLRGLANTVNQLNGLQFHLFGWPAASLLFIWILFLPGANRTSEDWLCLSFIAAVLGVFFFYFFQDFCYGPRFLYEAIPFLVILTARGMEEALSRLRMHLPESQALGLFYGPLLAFTIIALSTIWVSRLYDLSHAYWDTNEEVADRLRQGIVEPDALVFIENYDDYGAVFSFLDPALKRGWIVARDLGEEENQKLIQRYANWPVYVLRYRDAGDRFETRLERYKPENAPL